VKCRGNCRQSRKTGKGKHDETEESTCDTAYDREMVNVLKRKQAKEKERKSVSMREGW